MHVKYIYLTNNTFVRQSSSLSLNIYLFSIFIYWVPWTLKKFWEIYKSCLIIFFKATSTSIVCSDLQLKDILLKTELIYSLCCYVLDFFSVSYTSFSGVLWFGGFQPREAVACVSRTVGFSSLLATESLQVFRCLALGTCKAART